ncbi:MAG: hypothetical protein ACJ75Q_10775 [Gaiellaceae bacterium]
MIGAVAYLTAMGVWIYVVGERQLFYGQPEADLALLLVLAGVQVGAGLLVGRWWALAFPVVAVALAVPAGYPDANKGEPWPIWLSLALLLPIALLLVGIGAVGARVRRRRLS